MGAHWQWENAAAGAVAGFTTVAGMHPLDVVRTRFQVNDGRGGGGGGISRSLPTYKNTSHALFTIARLEGLRGLYAGFFPAVIVSYGRAKQRYAVRGGSDDDDEKLTTPALLHLASAAEAGALVCLCTNPIWLVKTRLQLQTPLHQSRRVRPYYSGLLDAFTTIMNEEGPRAFYKGLLPSLLLGGGLDSDIVSFSRFLMVLFSSQPYEELCKVIVDFKETTRQSKTAPDYLLNSADYALLGGSSKVAALLLTYPFQVIRARLQQRPSTNGMPRYIDSLHVVRETARFEGLRGFYKGLTANLLKNVPASSITFIVYENILKLLKQPPT